LMAKTIKIATKDQLLEISQRSLSFSNKIILFF
jgi:hypothetical protein